MDIARQPSRRMRAKIVAGFVAAAALLTFASTAWRSSAAAAPAVDRAAVWIERVRRGDLVREVAAQGTLVPEHVQWLSAGSPGRVARIALRAGAQVEPDTVVVVLENADLELAALQAEQQAASAQAALIQLDVRTGNDQKLQQSGLAALRTDLRDAKRHADAATQLAAGGLMGDLEFRDAQNKAEGLTERVQTEQAREKLLETGRDRQLEAQRVELARLREIAAFRRRQLEGLQVRAGIRGVVQDVPLENGQWVATGALLAKVAEPDRLKAEVRVAESDAKEIHKGLGVRFEVPAGLRGRVERVDPTVVAGSVRVEVALEGPLPAGARADQTASGYVEIDKLEGVLFVARPAGVQEQSTSELFRLEPDRVHAERVAVRLGRGSARAIEIAGGLTEGDSVVVSDTSTWETSGRVRLQ